MYNNLNEIDKEKVATYNQVWSVGYFLAESVKDRFPDINLDTLARRLRASILNYHENDGSYLSKSDVQLFLSGDKYCPKYYLERVVH
jgi:hypothetical protein